VDQSTKTGPIPPESVPDTERRRIGEVVHDDRGNASVRWLDAPSDYQRPVLELARDSASARKPEESFDPYGRGATPGTASSTPGTATSKGSTGNTTRTDLRKLSEWIKLMRELEERKRNGGDQD
jgi:hypothetical protein